MSQDVAGPNLDDLSLSDPDTDDLFASPSAANNKSKSRRKPPPTPEQPTVTPRAPPLHDDPSRREGALRAELANIRNVNEIIEGVISSLDRAKENMNTVSQTVQSSTSLLQTWTQILSQTEHNQRLILNPSWQGANQDVVDMENEQLARQQERERKEFEEARRREESVRRAEQEEEKRKRGESAVGRKGVRGRGRGRVAAGTGYVGVGGQGTSIGRGSGAAGRRGSSSIGRSSNAGRARGRTLP